MTVRHCLRKRCGIRGNCVFHPGAGNPLAQPLASIEGTLLGCQSPSARGEPSCCFTASYRAVNPIRKTPMALRPIASAGFRSRVFAQASTISSPSISATVPFNSFLDRFRLGAPPLTLTAGQHKTDVVIEMVALTVVSGKVTDEDGNPIPDVTVRSLRPAFTLNGHLRIGNTGSGFHTDAEGKYQLTVDPGHWYLSFSTEGLASDKPERGPDEPERSYVTTYYPGTRDLSIASWIDAAAGQQMTALNVRLQKTPVYHVRGKIAGGAGSIRPNLRVITTLETGDILAGMRDAGHPVRADGTFDIEGFAPGVWTLILMPAGTRDAFGSRTVKVTDRDVEDVVIAVQPPADLSGSVKMIAAHQSGANPSPATSNRLQVHLESLDSPGSFDALLESDGTFTIKDVEAGKYRVEVIPLSGGFVKSVIFDGVECIDSGIDLSGGAGDSRLQIVVSMNTGQISGTVTNPDGSAPSRAEVTLVPDGSATALYRWELNLFTWTGTGGQFIVRNVVPGTYRVYAWERLDPVVDGSRSGDPVVFADPGFPRLFDNMGTVVTVGENESKQVSLTPISAARVDEESRRLH